MNRQYQPRPMPTKEEIGENEVLVEITSAKEDNFHRIHFFAYWYDPKTPAEGGPTDHVRGQNFHVNLESFTATVERRGQTVRLWEPPGRDAGVELGSC